MSAGAVVDVASVVVDSGPVVDVAGAVVVVDGGTVDAEVVEMIRTRSSGSVATGSSLSLQPAATRARAATASEQAVRASAVRDELTEVTVERPRRRKAAGRARPSSYRCAVRDPARLYIALGVTFTFCVRAFWVAAAVYWATDAGLAPYQLVLLGSALEGGVLVAEIPTGAVADVVSRRLSVVLSFLGVGAAIVLASSTTSFAVLMVSQALLGVAWTFQSGADTAWITDELDGADVSALILSRARAQLLATVAGTATGGLLGATAGLPTAMAVAGALLLIVGPLLGALMPEHGFERRRSRAWAAFRTTLVAGARLTRRTRDLRLLVVVLVLVGAGSEAVDRLDVRRLVDVGLPGGVDTVVWVTAIVVVEALCGWVLLRSVERRLDGRSPANLLSALVGATAVAVGLVSVVAEPWTISILLVGQSATRSGIAPIATAWANRRATSDVRATVLSYIGQAEAMGELAGGLALGAVAAAAGLPWALRCAALCFAVGALFAASGPASIRSPAR